MLHCRSRARRGLRYGQSVAKQARVAGRPATVDGFVRCNDGAQPDWDAHETRMRHNLRVNGARLQSRLERLAEAGARPDGGVCRLALTEADGQGRDLVVGWMRELGLEVTIDAIGNVVGVRAGPRGGRARR